MKMSGSASAMYVNCSVYRIYKQVFEVKQFDYFYYICPIMKKRWFL